MPTKTKVVLDYQTAKTAGGEKALRRRRSIFVYVRRFILGGVFAGLLAVGIIAIINSELFTGLYSGQTAALFLKIQKEILKEDVVEGIGLDGERQTFNDGYSCWLRLGVTNAGFDRLAGILINGPLNDDFGRFISTSQVSDDELASMVGHPEWWIIPSSPAVDRIRIDWYFGKPHKPFRTYWFLYDRHAQILFIHRSAP